MSDTQQDHQIKGLTAQLEAHKQMLNETLNTSIQLRANAHLFQQALQEANQKITDLTAELDTCRSVIENSKKIIEDGKDESSVSEPEAA